MKVAMVTPYWFPVRGGLTTYVHELSETLRSDFGIEVLVLAREGGGPGATTLGGKGLRFAAAAVRALEGFRPDVVHAHGHWYALQAGLRYRSRHPGARVVFTLHTELPGGSPVHRRLLGRLLGRLLSRADVVTAVSLDLLGQTVRTFRVRTRTRVTRPGVTLGAPSRPEVEAFLARHGLAGRRPLISFVGPLQYARKARGVEHLIRAMPLVRARVPGATLAVAGEGRQREALESVARAVAPGAVEFLGTVEDPRLLLAAADVCAHVSFQEGLPMAVLEAMAAGRPVLATAVGGIPEAVRDGENGVLVGGEPEEIAARLAEILEDPARARALGARGAEDAAILWPWSKSARKFVQLYGGRTPHRVLVTVDVERDYHAPARAYRGVEEALPKLLSLFEKHGVRAHFFVTGDVAERYPERVRELLERGHAVGSHGESHDVESLRGRPYAWQLASLTRATEALERVLGSRPTTFRAPNFSADGATLRALEVLGYRVDSSVLPGRVVRAKRVVPKLDFLNAPRDPYLPSRRDPALPGASDLLEVPVTENPDAPGGPVGLGYLHAQGVDATLDAVSRSAAEPCVFLIHPWELLEPPRGDIPAWMRRACSPDPSRLDAFLSRLGREHELTTVEAEIPRVPVPRDWRQGTAPARATGRPVLLLVTNVYAPVVGGISTYVAHLARAVGSAYEVRILAYPEFLVRHEAARSERSHWRLVHAAWGLLVLAAVAGQRLRGRPVVVHSQSAAFCLMVGYLARALGARAVHTFHSPLTRPSLILRFFTHRLDAAVFVSPALRELYRKAPEAWNDHEAILPGAVEVPELPSEEGRATLRKRLVERYSLAASDHLALFAGRVVEDKGIEVLAKAAGHLGNGWAVAVAGPAPSDGRDPARWTAAAGAAAEQGRFRLLGVVPREDLGALYDAADVVVVPSLWPEPAPLVAIEAMAHGRPVVASRIGGLPFLVPPEAGILVPPGDPGALAGALRRLGEDPALRASLGRAARRVAQERHSLRRFGLEHRRLYASL